MLCAGVYIEKSAGFETGIIRDRVYIDKDKDNEEIPEDHLPCAAGR
jgi:hypothetical protein